MNKQIEEIRANVIAHEEFISKYKNHQIVYPGSYNTKEKRLLLDHIDEIERDNERLKNIGARLAGCLWDYHNICPECGNKKGDHMPCCQKTYEREYKSPTDCQSVFNRAFEFDD